ncbi:hypothetical protein [Natrinema caseinilyticum]|uniref:hypothetical protein n=1 Tax=Natrinema caseinilyticum TaxID=2961570 RepID=UPI0020C4C394|nr:hypothetical protein [Natrinema caseinilyticum]
MIGDHMLPRRTVLASLGTSALGGIVTTGTAIAQDRDPSEYDRPRTIEENGVEITQWDCSRAILDGPNEIVQIIVAVQYNGISQPEGIRDTVSGLLDVHNFDLPVDIRVNDHLDEFDPLDGSVIIEGVSIYNSLGERTPLTTDPGLIATFAWPIGEWECHEVRGMVPPDDIIRPKSAIPYEYNVEPY